MRQYQTGSLSEAQCKVLAAALDAWSQAHPIPEGDHDLECDEELAAEMLEWFDEPAVHLVPLYGD